MKFKRTKCYSFIEIMVVVIIIAILSAVVMPKFAGRTEDAKISAAQGQISNFQSALETYQLDNGKYPTTEQGIKALIQKPTSPPIPSSWKGPYLSTKTVPKDPWGNEYKYLSPGKHNPESYDIYSYGPDGQEGGGDDITNW